ncbi:hypothetical protein I312_103261 [Cryptococcus bacillisporus CA1280]|uniref:uncharacterized protein n=1 Tax=Cryptococcus bacillisporus CA1280 TaxID=1296109 RepID=UPI003367D7E6
MSKVPNKPPKIEPSHIYLQVSHLPSQIPATALDNPPWQLKYVGQPVKRDESLWIQGQKALVEKVKDAQGVKSVKILPEVKQRTKREEF